MTRAEVCAWNDGVRAVLAIAEKSAAILARDPRRIPVAFARSALIQLAHDGEHLLIGNPTESTKALPPGEPKGETPLD